MKYFEEIIYLLNWKGIGRSEINRGFASWIRKKKHDRRALRGCPAEPSPAVGKCTGSQKMNRQNDRLEEAAATADQWLIESGKRKKEPAAEGNLSLAQERSRAFRQAEKVLQWLSEHKDVTVCTIFDETYPKQLNDLGSQRPPVLYMKGRHDRFDVLSVPMPAVIGGRWPCRQAAEEGPDFVRRLAEKLQTGIISGLARGCDRMGHESALDAGIFTAAVMPCGLDFIVPEINRDLAERILENNGCLISEYAPGTPPAEYRYTERDRITAALSAASVVVECETKSGTMATVQAAVSMKRPVACWLPEFCPEGFAGNRRMVKEMQAEVIRDDHTLQEFLKRMERDWQEKCRERAEAVQTKTEPEEQEEQLSFLSGTEFRSE